MKKRNLIITLISCILFYCCSYKSSDHYYSRNDYEKIINEDLSQYRNCDFYESTIEFDRNTISDSSRIKQITNVFRKSNGEWFKVNHLINNIITTFNISEIKSYPENSPINFEDSVGLSLRGVINTIKLNNINNSNSNNTIKLFQPQKGSSVFVLGDIIINAQTGKIKKK